MIHDIGLRKYYGNSDVYVIFLVYCTTLSVSLYTLYGRCLLNDFGQVLEGRIYGYRRTKINDSRSKCERGTSCVQ